MYLPIFKALELLQVSKPTFYRLVKRGVIRRVQIPTTRKFLYSKKDIDALLAGNHINPDTHHYEL